MTGIDPEKRENPTAPGECAEQDVLDKTVWNKLKHCTALFALFSTLFISALNTAIIATAIPTICNDLGSATGYAWIGGAYLLAETSFAPIWAKVSDIWGRKPILLALVVGFFGSSIVCATSKSMAVLILGRTLQGAAGGGLIPLVTIVIADIFSIRNRALYLGIVQAVWALSCGIGPLLGGTFSQYLTWRWIFWINLPISGTVLLLLSFTLEVHNPKTPIIAGIKAIDWIGCVTLIGSLVMPLLALTFGGILFPWNSPQVICLLVFGCLTLFMFVFNEAWLAKYPLLPPGLFRRKSNVACLVITATHFFCVNGVEYYLPLYFQSALEVSPVRSAVLLLPLTLTGSIIGALSGVFIHLKGRYIELIWGGVVLFIVGNGLYIHFSEASPLIELVGVEILAGLGAGLLFDSPLIALQALVSQDDTAMAIATHSLVRSIGTFMAITIGGIIFQNGMSKQLPALKEAGVPESTIELFSGDTAVSNVGLIKTISDSAHNQAVRKAFVLSLRGFWILGTSLLGCAVVASVFISKQELNREHVETKTGIRTDSSSPIIDNVKSNSA